ncbi:MAG: hypothetical protein IKD09_05300 [Lentisphaeria bacterium]|nr:hypothetical protein [Lentisphaeria bacterium]
MGVITLCGVSLQGKSIAAVYLKNADIVLDGKITESAWVITTTKSSVEIRDYLKGKLDKNDKLFVGKLTGEAAWSGESQEVAEWLKKNL